MKDLKWNHKKNETKKMNPENITKDKQYGINPLHYQNKKEKSTQYTESILKFS